ncbi:hypothetical protein DBR21_11760 [Caulobacter sp. HMWF009]|nr:hypothetical protein DBR21_11760 [Caulobacter sp. HMWF009]
MLVVLALVAACSPGYENPNRGRPVEAGHIRLSWEQVDPRRAPLDAAAARGRGDRHLLGVYTYSSVVPGGEAVSKSEPPRPVLFIEDTGDQVRGLAHSAFNKRAAAYALAYNRALLSTPRPPGGS